MASTEEMLRTAVQTAQINRFTSVAAGTLIVLDHLITLDQEIELIWRSSNGSGKWLFIVNRYYGLIAAIFNNYALFVPRLTDSFCRRWYQWQGCSGIILYLIAELILQLRLFALYHLNRKVLAVIIVSFVVAATSSGTLMGIVLRELSGYAVVLVDTPVCAAKWVPRYFYVFWIPILAFETLLCGLAVYRGFQNMRFKSSFYYSGKEIVDVLLRDSVVYFIVLFTTYAVNMVLFLVEPGTLIEVPIVFAAAMSCIMSNRLLLSIRQTVHDRDDVMLVSPHTAYRTGPFITTRVEFMEMEEMESPESLR
ncbi:hypothetical protein BDM02DRAFT_3261085 [Thelephora ganbajun]|uniref:Uncharacterized protein n=1 Tax=Thelephora ganbajun TaxID=370292 RepID=A0ACB6ZG74_THEGA|nr:hypothetical protein BDM02DRAFT_3261085 [Thelephora ganbajun]